MFHERHFARVYIKCHRHLMGRGQAVRHWFLVPAFGGSNPSAPAKHKYFTVRHVYIFTDPNVQILHTFTMQYDYSGTEDQLVRLEKEFWNAAANPDFYVENFAENGIMVLPFQGGIIDKSNVLDVVAKASAWKTYDLDKIQFIHINSDTIVLIYKATAEREGQPLYTAHISSTYIKNERWQLLLHQQTPFDR
jgi:hypothetical protein